MHKNNFYISFGVWLVIIPILGLPIVWRDTLVFLSGLFLILVSLGPIILKKLQQSKPKIKRKQELPKEELRFSEKETISPPISNGDNSPPAPLL
jgi:hypothetical protein